MAYKVFTNGSTLQASELNENLMQQSIATFSNSAARSAAITSPVAGQMTYLIDSDEYESWDGGSWVSVASIGAWKSWAPNLNDGSWTQGNGTFSAIYTQIGKTVIFKLEFTSGTTTNETTNLRISLPVEAVASNTFMCNGHYLSGSTRNFISATSNTSTSVGLGVIRADSTYATHSGISSTVPFTWAAGDQILLNGIYQAA